MNPVETIKIVLELATCLLALGLEVYRARLEQRDSHHDLPQPSTQPDQAKQLDDPDDEHDPGERA